jgi:hypothetical protein
MDALPISRLLVVSVLANGGDAAKDGLAKLGKENPGKNPLIQQSLAHIGHLVALP